MRKMLSLLLCTAVGLGMTVPINSSAATVYQVSSERGQKYLSWTKDVICWTCTSSKITDSDTWQEESGFFVQNMGIDKLNRSYSQKHWYNCRNKFLMGAEIYGVTIGWDTIFTDQWIVDYKGNSTWKKNI